DSAPAKALGPVFRVLDLKPHYDRLLSSFKPAESWALPPRGSQTFNGVTFFVEGKIELTGLGAARNNRFLPARVTGIPVHGRGRRLHLLHGAGYADADGAPMSEVLLRYEDGGKAALFIAYRTDALGWAVIDYPPRRFDALLLDVQAAGKQAAKTEFET